MTSAYESDPIFQTNPLQVLNIVTRIENQEIALPDFQRDFVWDPTRTAELIGSVMSRYPVGTLLFWEQGEGQPFASRSFDGAPSSTRKSPSVLVLDGQQRLTSLYQALTGSGDERYFIKVDEFVDIPSRTVREVPDVNFEQAIFSIPATARNSRKAQRVTRAHLPIADVHKFDDWLDDYADAVGDDPQVPLTAKEAKSLYREMRDKYISPLKTYGLPVLTLPSSTSMDAVCTIFETLNRTGKPLGPFELLTARFFPQGVNLRDLWDEGEANHKSLKEFRIDPYNILQAICLRVRGTAQRSDVLKKLNGDEIKEHWSSATAGFAGVIDMLQSDCGVTSQKWLPYGMILTPMAAVWDHLKELKPLERSQALRRLQQFFWASTFTTNYDQGANSQMGADYSRLSRWVISGDGEAPEAVSELPINATTLRTASVRRKALYSGLMCLLIKNKAADFHTGQSMTVTRAVEAESHHIFPKGYLAKQAGTESAELMLNRALIDGETNRIISNNAPSSYIEKMRSAYGKERLADVLASHAISSHATSGLLRDDYSSFLDERLEIVIQMIEEATGKMVQRDAVH
ncbi:GmrSD restriction endonuclease domain-containing protein [Streptomyces sp. NPDC001546]|uniref:GmrSD restriction endonuclease domain-containing protein n=1 Tax=Streptomyces sp. NPDC001546 TaxID=3364585 RepID=UPI00369293CF